MTIKNKRIFWTDLGLARKVYRNLAIYDREHKGAMRRMGSAGTNFQISKLFSNSNFMNSIRSNTSNKPASAPNNRERTRTYLDVAKGAIDAAPVAINKGHRRPLSTVIEEERISGYSSS